jgi:hypothetical protein
MGIPFSAGIHLRGWRWHSSHRISTGKMNHPFVIALYMLCIVFIVLLKKPSSTQSCSNARPKYCEVEIFWPRNGFALKVGHI